MSNKFKVAQPKFKVADDVTKEDIENALGELNGFEMLAPRLSETQVEGVIDGIPVSGIKQPPKPDPEEDKEE